MRDDDEADDREHESFEALSFSLRPRHIEQLRLLSKRYGVSQSHVLRDALEVAFKAWREREAERHD